MLKRGCTGSFESKLVKMPHFWKSRIAAHIFSSWNQPDCETLMVDPQANVYIVSRVDDGRGVLFQLPNSAWGTGQKVQISSTAVIYAPSTHHDPVGGDISPNGKEVLIKVYYSCLITIQ